MRADPPSKRLLWSGLVASALLALLVVFVLRSGTKGGDQPSSASPPGSTTAAATPPEPPAPGAGPAANDGEPPDPTVDPTEHSTVDLEKLRARLPDNSYWRLSAPTKDPDVLRARGDEARRTNELYGKVLSNTASEEEIRGYYAERRKVSEDSIEFAATVLKEYGNGLPTEERGLYELSINMHRSRLRDMPKQIDDAIARKAIQDQRRRDWRQGQAN
ncbi:MAG: hypothetical protein MUF34_29835 [Polyangiaceae bacterium]|jgi:hypothetical protein|nr:hypothetical protein [Polyangiaceae bacterium]